jgi:hypothetical protein
MGIYETTLYYYGRLLSRKAYQRLQDSCTDLDKFIEPVGNNYYILHAPGRCAKNINDWQEPSGSELETLTELIKIASNSQDEQPATYMCEIQWSTLNLPADDARPIRNIRID